MHAYLSGFLFMILLPAASMAQAADGRVDVEEISVSSSGASANFPSRAPALDAAGRFVVFESFATNLVEDDDNGESDVFLRDRKLGETTLVSRSVQGGSAAGASLAAAISADASRIAFVSDASDLVEGDRNPGPDVFVMHRESGVFELVSVAADGSAADGPSGEPVLSGDGRFVAFSSAATNLVTQDTNGRRDVFLRDLDRGVTRRISVGPDGVEGDRASAQPSVSDDGRSVAFSSSARTLVAGDDNDRWDVFLWRSDRPELLALSRRRTKRFADGDSRGPSISADGQRVAFSTWAGNVVRGAGARRESLLVCDIAPRLACHIASVSSTGEALRAGSWDANLSGDGSTVAFFTLAALGTKNLGEAGDVLLRNLRARVTEHALAGVAIVRTSMTRMQPALSRDGATVAFVSAPGDGKVRSARGDSTSIFLRERGSGAPTCGNLRVDVGEECDRGLSEFFPGLACTGTCKLVACGDLDANGRIAATDAVLALGLAIKGGPCDSEVCDVDRSGGAVAVSDALAILKAALAAPPPGFCAASPSN